MRDAKAQARQQGLTREQAAASPAVARLDARLRDLLVCAFGLVLACVIQCGPSAASARGQRCHVMHSAAHPALARSSPPPAVGLRTPVAGAARPWCHSPNDAPWLLPLTPVLALESPAVAGCSGLHWHPRTHLPWRVAAAPVPCRRKRQTLWSPTHLERCSLAPARWTSTPPPATTPRATLPRCPPTSSSSGSRWRPSASGARARGMHTLCAGVTWHPFAPALCCAVEAVLLALRR